MKIIINLGEMFIISANEEGAPWHNPLALLAESNAPYRTTCMIIMMENKRNNIHIVINP